MISEFPVFTGKIEHAHTVCTRPSLSQREGPGDEARLHPSSMQLQMGCAHVYNYIVKLRVQPMSHYPSHPESQTLELHYTSKD